MRVLSLFSGIGAFEKALERLGIEFELVNYCEIDRHAAKAYSLIHGVSEDLNLKDVTTVDTSKLKDIDLITYGFPCQDISISGYQKGFFDDEGNVTRSGLFFEALRIIEDTKPKYAIAENVKNLMSKSFEREFDIVINSLGKAGYNNYCKVLNSCDYGIPQHRERVFIVSIRKDVDDCSFQFPAKMPLPIRLKDLLERDVDERFYLKETLPFFIKNSFDMEKKGNGFRFSPHVKANAQIANTITTRAGWRMDDNFVMDIDFDDEKFRFENSNPQVMQIGNVCHSPTRDNSPVRLGNIYGDDRGTGYAGNVWDSESISPALTTMQGGNRQPMIIDVAETLLARDYKGLSNYGSNAVIEPCNNKMEMVEGEEGLARTVSTEKCSSPKILVRENNKRGYTEAYEGDTINLEQPNSKTRRGRVGRGVAQTINTGTLQGVVVDASHDPIIIDDIYKSRESREYSEYAPTLRAGKCGELKVICSDTQTIKANESVFDFTDGGIEVIYPEEPFIVASRGRNPSNPSDRTRGSHMEQRFEANTKGICNTLTTVQKDNYVCEPRLVGGVGEPEKLFNIYPKNGQAGNVYNENCIAPCVPGFGGGGGGKELKVLHDLRIRKLTPKECFRLMGFDDKDIDILVENNISNTQLYKMAGNSIVVDVLERIFECLILKKNMEPDLFTMMGFDF